MANDGHVKFGSRLEQLLADRKLTVREFDKLTGYDASLISRITRGEREATPEFLKCAARALGLPLGDLVAGTDAEAKLATPSKFASHPIFIGALGALFGQESKVHDLEAQIRTLRDDLQQERKAREDAEQEKGAAQRSVEFLAKEKEALTERISARKGEIARAREVLAQAANEVKGLKRKATAVVKEIVESKANVSPTLEQFLMSFKSASDTTLAKLFDTDSLFATDFDYPPGVLPPPTNGEK
jgi:transcriptional regulator with XRE-family HTH domain